VRVDVVTGNEPPHYTLEFYRHLPATLGPRLLRSKGYGSSFTARLYRSFDHPRQVRRQRRRGSHLHIDTQMLAYLLRDRRLREEGPTVVTCHDVLQFLPRFQDPSYESGEDRRGLDRLREGLQAADRIVAPSEHTKKDLVAQGFPAASIEVVPHGIDPGVFHPCDEADRRQVREKYRLPPDRPVVLFVGTEHPRKNLPALFRAFAAVKTDAVLLKIGPPRQPQRRELESLATNLKIRERVVFLDSPATGDLPRLFAAADVLVLPSLYEGFGLPPLEAMASGTPVAVSRITSLPEVVRDAGLYFDPEKEDTISAAITRLLTDASLRETLRALGLARAAQFRWEDSIARLLRAYAAAESAWSSKRRR